MELKKDFFEKFKNGQIDSIYRNMYPQLLSYAVRNLGSNFSFLAEDCVQDSFFTAYTRRHEYIDYEHFKSFLYLSLRNKIISIMRHNHAQENYFANLSEDLSPAYINTIIQQETYNLLYEAIESLPSDLKQIFNLSFIQGKTIANIAVELGISESTVKRKKILLLNAIRNKLLKQTNNDLSSLSLLVLLLLNMKLAESIAS